MNEINRDQYSLLFGKTYLLNYIIVINNINFSEITSLSRFWYLSISLRPKRANTDLVTKMLTDDH